MKPPLRAIVVCVDYADILSVTLPYNEKHFKEIMVVTSWGDKKTRALVHALNARQFVSSDECVLVHETNAFYERGAKFNKWAALEEGLDVFGRHGFMTLLDADVLWPKDLKGALDSLVPGNLYTPRRRMCPTLPVSIDRVPDERTWARYPLHHNDAEFAGYSQIFHAGDPTLGARPWHDTNWKHAGGADSFFQMKWKDQNKIRPSFEVLHLGDAGSNWMGRVTAFADGTLPSDAAVKRGEMMAMFRNRTSKRGPNRFQDEKI